MKIRKLYYTLCLTILAGITVQDVFAHKGVVEGRFTAQQADGAFTPEMNTKFNKWLFDNAETMGKFFDDPAKAPSAEFIRAFVKERQTPRQAPQR